MLPSVCEVVNEAIVKRYMCTPFTIYHNVDVKIPSMGI